MPAPSLKFWDRTPNAFLNKADKEVGSGLDPSTATVPLKVADTPDRVSINAKPFNTCGCGDLAAPPAVGPFIRFTGYHPATQSWTGTVLYACKPSVVEVPSLSWSAVPRSPVSVDPIFLDSYGGWNFWRFEMEIPVQEEEQMVKYWVNEDQKAAEAFYIAGLNQPWHWAYYSCNGFTSDVPQEDKEKKWGGVLPLWEDLISRHKALPMHCMVGGGDQLYNDDVLSCPALQAFFETPAEERVDLLFAEEMQNEVADYYFHHYCIHFAYGAIGEAMKSIPAVMSWDDHDIFDGWGSYPLELHESEVFQGIFTTARRFYLLFQMHTNTQLARTHGCFGKAAFNQLVLLGPRVALALPDCRAQRTENQVLSLDTHMNLILKTEELPDTVRHLVLGTTVPVVYPHLKGGEAILKTLGALNKYPIMAAIFKAVGIAGAVFNDMGEPELLDDLMDHWTGPHHSDERRFLIEHLQMLAKAKNLRISIISGDVHLAATGRLYSYPKPQDLSRDFRFMPQIVCSAIANAPPPDGLVTFLHLMGRAGFVNKFTKNKMCKLFDCSGKYRMFNRRNWCEIWEVPSLTRHDSKVPTLTAPCADGADPTSDPGALIFNLRVENFKTAPAVDRVIGEYPTVVPVLRAPVGKAGRRLDFYGKKGWSRRYMTEELGAKRKMVVMNTVKALLVLAILSLLALMVFPGLGSDKLGTRFGLLQIMKALSTR